MIDTAHHPDTVLFDWRWAGVGYCLFVVLHLLPSMFLGQFLRIELAWEAHFMVRLVWIYVGLLYVGFYGGYRPGRFRVLEAGISSFLYLVTVYYLQPGLLPQEPILGIKKVILVISMLVVAITTAQTGNNLRALMKGNKKRNGIQGTIDLPAPPPDKGSAV